MKRPFLCIILLTLTIVGYSQDEDILLADGKYCKEVNTDSISRNQFYIPSNIEECIMELDKLLDAQPKKILAQAKDYELKRIMGMYVFSEWTEHESTRLCCYFKTKGINDFQDRDYLILLAYKRHLLNQTFDIDKECNRIAQYHDSIRQEHNRQYEKNITADYIDGVYIPVDIDDCILSLDKLLNDTVKNELREVEDPIEFHFGLGRWMRNNWGLWGGSRLQLWFISQGINQPDDMSGIILSIYWEYIRSGNINISQKIDEVKKEYEIFNQQMKENTIEFLPVGDEEDYYSDEYKDFLRKRRIDGIFFSR